MYTANNGIGQHNNPKRTTLFLRGIKNYIHSFLWVSLTISQLWSTLKCMVGSSAIRGTFVHSQILQISFHFLTCLLSPTLYPLLILAKSHNCLLLELLSSFQLSATKYQDFLLFPNDFLTKKPQISRRDLASQNKRMTMHMMLHIKVFSSTT